MTDPVNLHELRPTRTGALAAGDQRNSDSLSSAAAAHPYRSIARAVSDEALDGWNGNIDASRDPWDLPTAPIFLSVAELNERCQPLIQALQCARAA